MPLVLHLAGVDGLRHVMQVPESAPNVMERVFSQPLALAARTHTEQPSALEAVQEVLQELV